MFNLMVFFLFCFFFILLIYIFIFFMSLKKFNLVDSSSGFECGFNSMNLFRIPFSVHFFLIAIIFLIFDIEVIIILPVVFCFCFCNLLTWLYTCMFFIFILILGLYIEWYSGMLNWCN